MIHDIVWPVGADVHKDLPAELLVKFNSFIITSVYRPEESIRNNMVS